MKKTLSANSVVHFILFILLNLAFFAGCKKSNNTDVYAAPPDLTTKITSSVSGFVTDENDAAVKNATVQFGTATLSTDNYGYFEAKNIEVVKDAATVTVTKPGYFKGIKTYLAATGKSAFFRIKLIPKTITGTVSGNNGGTVTLPNGLSVNLPANAVVNAATNAAYTGTINVSSYWINPTATDLPGIMPGDLRGVNTDGNVQLLTTYGMAAVELTGSGGELLQIAPGKKATLTLPIPAAISSSAPATIPLWYFNEASGLWKQEGSATKTGNNYIGDVSHFSFWNCDGTSNFVQLNATIVDNLNHPIPNAAVKISVVGNTANLRYGYTNSAGFVSGPIPANTQLLFEVYSNLNCKALLYSQNITVSNENISMGTITVTNTNNLITIKGNVTNCSNAPVTNGYVMASSGNLYTRINLSNTGGYSGFVFACNNSLTLTAEDLTTQMTSNTVTANLVAGDNTIADIQVCGTPQQEYVNVTKNGTTQVYHYLFLSQASSTSYGIMMFMDAAKTIYAGHLQFTQPGIAKGSIQQLENINTTASTSANNMVITNPPMNIFITEYGVVGEYIAGNFSGYFSQPPSNTPFPVTCNFRIKRTF